MVKVEQTYDFEMPKHCGECKMWYVGFMTEDIKCCFTKQDVSWDIRDGKKPDWCPLRKATEGNGYCDKAEKKKDDIVALDFSEDIDRPSRYQTSDGKWHTGMIRGG